MSDEFAWIQKEISGLKGVQYSFKEEWGALSRFGSANGNARNE